jgi:probable F420-dependent oxidoreductase
MLQPGSIGVWSGALRTGDRTQIVAAAAQLEDLGYGAIWFPGGAHDDLADHLLALLGGTRHAVMAPGIVSIWTHPADKIAALHHRLTSAFPDRFLLGLGVSHADAVAGIGLSYDHPLLKMRAYLDQLDAAPTPVPIEERILAALGPRMLRLSAERSLGAHPYFVPPEHTRIARDALGPGKLLAPEQMVVVETAPARARAIARLSIGRYLQAPNYTSNLLRLGFSNADFEDSGSDRLVDAIVAWGDPAHIMDRVRAHHTAGADHVCIQVLTDPPADLSQSLAGWRRLASAR